VRKEFLNLKSSVDYFNYQKSYHIKYMFVGDSIKQDIQHYIASLRPVLQNRMQFIAHVGHAREDTTSVPT
jgi:hypothetical protein